MAGGSYQVAAAPALTANYVPKLCISGSADHKIVIWDSATWTVHHVLETPAAHVLSLAWWRVGQADGATSDDGNDVLVAGTWEGQLLVWIGYNSSTMQLPEL
jgi:WD40 repeat protein